jgi:crossover junction endodeoxyribonuclease RusA
MSGKTLELSLPFPPSVNSLWRVGRSGGMYRSPKYAEWRKSALWEVTAQVRTRKIKGEYKLTVHVVRPDKRHRDLDNIIKALSDILESSGVIENDKLCQHLEMKWVKDGPPCRVIIQELSNEEYEEAQR